jgi:hypothetical protein
MSGRSLEITKNTGAISFAELVYVVLMFESRTMRAAKRAVETASFRHSSSSLWRRIG